MPPLLLMAPSEPVEGDDELIDVRWDGIEWRLLEPRCGPSLQPQPSPESINHEDDDDAPELQPHVECIGETDNAQVSSPVEPQSHAEQEHTQPGRASSDSSNSPNKHHNHRQTGCANNFNRLAAVLPQAQLDRLLGSADPAQLEKLAETLLHQLESSVDQLLETLNPADRECF